MDSNAGKVSLQCLDGRKSLQQVEFLEDGLSTDGWRLLEQQIYSQGVTIPCSVSCYHIWPYCLGVHLFLAMRREELGVCKKT